MSEAAVLARHIANGEQAGQGTVLIVDDEASIRESLQTLLEMEGYQVETAASGEEGLAHIAEQPVDLVLLDFALPDRNGVEVLREIRDRDPLLPVIMITAYGDERTLRRAREAGAEGVFGKPIDFSALKAEIDQRLIERGLPA